MILALAGGELLYLEVDLSSRCLTQVASVVLDQDIACMSLQGAGGGGDDVLAGSSEKDAGGDSMDIVAENQGQKKAVQEMKGDNSMMVDDDTASSSSSMKSVSKVNSYRSKNSTNERKSTMLAVGMWTDSTVRVFALPSLQELTRVQLGAERETQARDVLLASLGEVPTSGIIESFSSSSSSSSSSTVGTSSSTLYLLVGLGDGTLITFIVDCSTGLPYLTNRRKVVLGTHPISLTLFANASHGQCVFASCDRPTVVSGKRNGKLIFSVVNIQEVMLQCDSF